MNVFEIKHPEHYKKGKRVETWNWIEMGMTEEQFEGFLLGNIYKYLHRYKSKGKRLDLEKAKEYIDKLIETEYPGAEN
jgi:hypothetical protein